jgi:PDZ domain-containing protein
VGFAGLLGILVLSVLPATLHARTPRGEEAQFAVVPSDAQPVADRLTFDAVQRYRAKGEILFVTVRDPEISLLDWLVSRGLGEVSLLSYTDRFGTQTPSQQRQVNFQMMRSAKQTAEYVALKYLGYPAELVPGDVVIGQILCLRANAAGDACATWPPAHDVLEAGDQLVSVDGDTISDIDDLQAALAEHQPGDTVRIGYQRDGESGAGDVQLIASPDDPSRTIIGFQPFDTDTAKLPFEVDISTEDIGGPSAGLAFTLTLIDELTPGELTGDHDIAVTGTIQTDGTVGAIGGLTSKTSAVKQQGAKVFIVPSAQGEADIAAARAVAGDDLVIVPVDDLEGALDALAKYGGNGLQLGKPGESYHAGS